MSFRTNPDRILNRIDKARESISTTLSLHDRQARGRDMTTEVPESDATVPERLRRVFALVESAYRIAAHSKQMMPLAARFRAVGDISHHSARGDVSISISYYDSERRTDVGVAPISIAPFDMEETRKETRTSRPDVNALKVLRRRLRDGVLGAYRKIEPRLRDALKERADMGHVEAEVTLDLRPEGGGEAEGAVLTP